MLLQLSWLANLLLITSAAAHAGPRKVFKPRALATGTGSLPSSSVSPPYPTGPANGTVSGTATPTGSVASPTATSTPISPSEFFFLTVASTGTIYDGQRLWYTGQKQYNGGLVLYSTDPESFDALIPNMHFSLLADGALYLQGQQGVAGLGDSERDHGWRFPPESSFENTYPYPPAQKAFCEIVGGALKCRTGSATIFYICPDDPVNSEGRFFVGPSPAPGCTEIGLIPEPF